MTIIQSEFATGQKQVTVPRESGVIVTERFSVTLAADTLAADIIEIGVLPGGGIPVDAVFISDECGTGTFNVGIMSGNVGSQDATRTVGAELFSAVADDSVVRATLPAVFGAIAPASDNRSIGVKCSAGITANGQVITVLLSYKV